MKNYITWKELGWALLAFLLVPVVINYLVFPWGTPMKNGSGVEADWLGFFGNYSGGFLGAVIAFVIARQQGREQEKSLQIQLNEQRKLEGEKRRLAQLPALIVAEEELRKIVGYIESAQKERERYTELEQIYIQNRKLEELSPEEFSNWVSSQEYKDTVKNNTILKAYDIALISEEVFSYVKDITNIDLHIELRRAFHFYKEFSIALNYDFDEEAEEFRKALNFLKTNAEETRTKSEIHIDYIQKNKQMKRLKKEVWLDFELRDMFSKFNELLRAVEEEIRIIRESAK